MAMTRKEKKTMKGLTLQLERMAGELAAERAAGVATDNHIREAVTARNTSNGLYGVVPGESTIEAVRRVVAAAKHERTIMAADRKSFVEENTRLHQQIRSNEVRAAAQACELNRRCAQLKTLEGALAGLTAVAKA